MKKIIAIILLLTSFLSCVACSGGKTEGAGVSETTAAEEQKPLRLDALTVSGVNISEFKIVYAKNAYTKVEDKSKLGTEYDFDRLSAEKLRDVIAEITGVTLECVEDSTDATEHEILVGKTNRKETTQLALNSVLNEKTKLAVKGGKLILCGGSYADTWRSAECLYDCISEKLADKATSLDLAEGTQKTRNNEDIIIIGCIGDSITAGSESTDRTLFSYPPTLGRALWKNCIVYNFGCGSTSLRRGTRRTDGRNKPYDSTNEYKDMMSKAKKVDVMLLMLGTNDPYYFPSWNESDSTTYVQEYKELLDDIWAKNPDMAMVLMNCPNYMGSERDRRHGIPLVRDAQLALYNDLNAEGKNVRFFDMYQYTKSELKKHMPDWLHPNDTGYVKMGNKLSEFLSTEADLGIEK